MKIINTQKFHIALKDFTKTILIFEEVSYGCKTDGTCICVIGPRDDNSLILIDTFIVFDIDFKTACGVWIGNTFGEDLAYLEATKK